MSDPFEILNVAHRRVEPDSAFRASLMDALSDAFDEEAEIVAPIGTGVVALVDHVEASMVEHRRRRALPLLVAAAAVIVAVGSIVLVRLRPAEPVEPATQPRQPAATTVPTAPTSASPSSTTTSTTSPPGATSVPFDPVGDATIAESILLEAEEYAPNVDVIDNKDVVLDRTLAADIPGCAVFLDTVFESPDRQAVTSWRTFYSPLPALLFEYVVVFPSEQAAQAMFDSLAEPTFGDACFQPYLDLLAERHGDFCCDVEVAIPPPLKGKPIDSAESFGADEIAFRLAQGEYYTNSDGLHGPEDFLEATVRVGRAVVIVEAITTDQSGNTVIDEDQFHAAIATSVTKARAALEDPPT